MSDHTDTFVFSHNRVARVLVVDDQKTQRVKMAMAVKHLGHAVDCAVDGQDAFEKLAQTQYDLVLLDILMPVMDGYEVLTKMKSLPELKHIPVIVISALDQEMDSVVEAIRLGAEDFLPKNFEKVLLNARINAALRKKFNRDQELEKLRKIKQLTDAAIRLEQSVVNPDSLSLHNLQDQQDSLGRLARVFTNMAEKVYIRECQLYHQVTTLKGSGLLLLVGAIFGLTVPLSKIAIETESHPFGLSLWINTFAALICLSITLFRGKFPSLDRKTLKVLLLWGLLGNAASEVFLFWSAERLPATVVAIVIICEGFLVYAYSAFTRNETTSPKRLTGLIVGMLGVTALLLSTESSIGSVSIIWIITALAIPLCYACEDIIIASALPDTIDLTAAFGLASLFGALCLLPVVIVTDDFIAIDKLKGTTGVTLLALTLTSVIGTVLMAKLLKSTGAVFGSQAGYVITFAGIAWSIVLLNEQPTMMTWLALCLMIAGLLLVEPKREADENLSFNLLS